MLRSSNVKNLFRSAPTRRTWTAGAAAIALLGSASVAACSSSPSSGGSANSGTLKIITWENPPAVTALKQIDAEFEKAYPKVKVQLGTAANVNGPYSQLLQTSVDSSTADIVTWVQQLQPLPLKITSTNLTPWQKWSTSGVFTSLNGQSFLNDYTAGAKAAETYKGNVYGVVSGVYQEGVFYNKAIFAQYHLSPPTTYSQFISELTTLKAHHVQPLWLATGGPGDPAGTYLQFIYYNLMSSLWQPYVPGKTLAVDLENGTVKWTDPHFTQVMTEERQIASYLEPDYTGQSWLLMPTDFAAGKAAMLLDGSWDMALVQAAHPKFQVGFFPLPGSNIAADNQSELQNDLTFSVPSASPHKALAMEWLKFFSQPNIYAQYVDTTGISSSQVSGTFNSYSAQVLGSWFGKGDYYTNYMPILSTTNSYYDQPVNWANLQQSMVSGSMTPQQVEQKYQSGWQTQ
jgi:raffinose/stachyose/melibiose transport system substrate-binding protein